MFIALNMGWIIFWGIAYVLVVRRGFIDKFPPEPGVQMWWVYDERGEGYDPRRDFPAEVDLDRVLARYEREGVLVVERDPVVIEQAVERHDQWWRDVTVGAWWAWYDPRD